jgi:hypothetical protein
MMDIIRGDSLIVSEEKNEAEMVYKKQSLFLCNPFKPEIGSVDTFLKVVGYAMYSDRYETQIGIEYVFRNETRKKEDIIPWIKRLSEWGGYKNYGFKSQTDLEVINKKQKYFISSAVAPKIGSIWRHYKGDNYKVVGYSIYDDNCEFGIKYISLKDERNQDEIIPWIRRFDEWKTVVYYKEDFHYRFTEISPKDGENIMV